MFVVECCVYKVLLATSLFAFFLFPLNFGWCVAYVPVSGTDGGTRDPGKTVEGQSTAAENKSPKFSSYGTELILS